MNKQQLANKIWASANKMRSKIEASEYKDYILGLIFYKFLSDNEVNYLLDPKTGGMARDDLKLLVENHDDPDAETLINFCRKNIGYFIEYKNLFSTWLQPDVSFSVSDLSVALGSFDRLVNPLYNHVYKGIFNTLQAGLQKLGETPTAQTRALKDLIRLIKDIPTDGKQDYDVLGYVYEYLISNFAANAGKKAGEFYTPHEVAMLMSEIVAEHLKKRDKIRIYDPTSGSGSLLITIGKSVGKHIDDNDRVEYYAQELKENTYNLTRMNLVMRGIKPDNINTRCADSLGEDWPKEDIHGGPSKPLCVDAVVSNPPYSQHWDNENADMDARFQKYGVAPKSKADYAFLLHELYHLDARGIMTIVLPHGVLFRGSPDDEGEGKIRRNLIEKNNIDAIIGLPANIFFGTGIPTLIMVLKQHRDNDDVLFIDASRGFEKDGTRNRLRACDIKRIVDTWRSRKEQRGFSRCVSRDLIRQNNYNLNIPRYIDAPTQTEHYDIYATLHGGIPVSEVDALQRYWAVLPSLRSELFKEDGSPYCTIRTDYVEATINDNADVERFRQTFANQFEGFTDWMHAMLIDNLSSVRELATEDKIADEIFRRMEPLPLVDCYAAYQALAQEWTTIMNDVEILQTEGMDACRKVDIAYKVVKKDNEEIEVPDGLKGRIIPFELIQRIKFQPELDAIETKQQRLEAIDEELNETRESLTEEEQTAYLDEQDNTKWNKKAVKADAKKNDDVDPETLEKLKRVVALWNEQTKTKKKLKDAIAELVNLTCDAIEALTDEEAAMLLHEKWFSPVMTGINATLTATLQSLQDDVESLAKKYATNLDDITAQMTANEQALSELVGNLQGDEYAVKGLQELFQSKQKEDKA